MSWVFTKWFKVKLTVFPLWHQAVEETVYAIILKFTALWNPVAAPHHFWYIEDYEYHSMTFRKQNVSLSSSSPAAWCRSLARSLILTTLKPKMRKRERARRVQKDTLQLTSVQFKCKNWHSKVKVSERSLTALTLLSLVLKIYLHPQLWRRALHSFQKLKNKLE